MGGQMTQDDIILDLHRKLAAETLRADQGWQRYESANADRNVLREERANFTHEIVRLREENKRVLGMLQFANNVIHDSAAATALLDVLAEPREAP